eukprot:EG_transcript_17581
MYWEPENTVAGFARAAELGADGVEFDVFKLRDEQLVVFHGGRAPRRNPETGAVTMAEGFLADFVEPSVLPGGVSAADDVFLADLDWQQVSTLRFRENSLAFDCPRDRLQGSGIPMLLDVLETCKQAGLHITVELKGPCTADGAVRMVRALDLLDRVTFSSFDHTRIERVKELCPSAATAALFEPPLPPNFVAVAKAVKADRLDMHYSDCTAEVIAEARQAGLQTMVWCSAPRNMKAPEDADLYARLAATGVDVMCVNRPDVLAELLGRPGVAR